MKRITALFAILITTLPLYSQTLGLSGTVTDSAGTTPIAGATVTLQISGQTTTTDAAGKFTLGGTSAISSMQRENPQAQILNGSLMLSVGEKSLVTVSAFSLQGREIYSRQKYVEVGSHSLALPDLGSGVGYFKVNTGTQETVLRALAKQAQTNAVLYDVLISNMEGYQKAYVSISNSDSSGIQIRMLKTTSPKFSFFVTSMKALKELSKSENGFGGDFRFGVTGAGAGLRGADKICATIAETSLKGSAVKGWRAFLSVTADASGKQVDAIDRIGAGPWYDRTGRILATKKADLLTVRPTGADAAIVNDLPNENGIPNHTPDPSKPSDDNHHTVTGSSETGTLKSATATCKDWTTAENNSANGKPSCGFSWPRNIGGGGGGPGGGTSGSNWMTTWDAPGCAAGMEVANGAGPTQAATQGGWIGGGGGYGGFYCFALNP